MSSCMATYGYSVAHGVFKARRVTQQQMPICKAHLSQNGQKTEPLRAAPQPHRRRSFDKQHQGARFDLLHLPICYDSILYYFVIKNSWVCFAQVLVRFHVHASFYVSTLSLYTSLLEKLSRTKKHNHHRPLSDNVEYHGTRAVPKDRWPLLRQKHLPMTRCQSRNPTLHRRLVGGTMVLLFCYPIHFKK